MLAAVHPTPATSLALAPAFGVGRGAVSLGRTEDNQVSAIALNSAAPQPLPEKLVNMVSRRHARLEVVAGHLELVDLGAVNGTFVNDARVEKGSRRVLQENDFVSLGGPSTISLGKVPRPNPWVWRVRSLHEFLARYVPPSQGPSPAVSAGAAPPPAPAGPPPPREMYSFSPKPAAAAAAAAGGFGSAAHALPPGTILPAPPREEEEDEGEEEEEEEEEVSTSSGVPADPTGPPGSIPVGSPVGSAAAAVAPAPAEAPLDAQQLVDTALLQEDSEERAQLAALEAYEASQLAVGPAAAAPASPSSQQGQLLQGQRQHGQRLQPPQQQQGQLQGRRPPPLTVPPRAEPEVVDLTADSPSPTSPHRRRPLLARQGGARAGGAGAAPAAAVAAAAGACGADVVDLLDVSPTKRPHGAQDEVEQGAKRARPSPDAHLQAGAAAAAPAPARPAAAAAGAGAAAGGAAGHLDELQESLPQCAICQDMPVVTHSMVPCGHSFCGECLAEWLEKKRDCPTCRVAGTAAPVRNHDMDKMIGALAAMGARAGTMSADDQEARREKLASWEEGKQELERKLKAPWAGRGAAPAHAAQHAGGAEVGGTLSALAAAILGGGGFGAFGPDPLGLLGDPHGGHAVGGRGGAHRVPARAPRVVPPPPRIAMPPQFEFRAELSTPGATARCEGCSARFAERTVRVGQRQQGQRPPPAWRWYHTDCMPAAYWHEARMRGIANLRGVPPADQARIRERLGARR